MSGLTRKQQLFVDFYVVHYNATRAVKQAYGQNPHERGTQPWERFEASARARGSENLTKPNVLQAVKLRQARIRQRFEFDEDMVVSKLASIVFTDLKDVGTWDETGDFRLYTPEDISDFHHGALRGVRHRKTTTTRRKAGEEDATVEVETTLEVLLHRDKVPAAKLLMQHGGWLQSGKMNVLPGGVGVMDNRRLSISALDQLSIDELIAAAKQMPDEPEETE